MVEGGIYGSGYGSTLLVNVTFYNNTAGSGGGYYIYQMPEVPPEVYNSIFWGNTPDQIQHGGIIPIVDHCLVQGGYPSGSHIIAIADPSFVDAANGNLRLQLGSSPAIDAGDSTKVPAEIVTDMDGNPRIFSDFDQDGIPDVAGIVDLGAYEGEILCLVHAFWRHRAGKCQGLPG